MFFAMARGHWLDPLARKILRATGHLPNRKQNPFQGKHSDFEFINQELEALKQKNAKEQSLFYLDVNRATKEDWQKLPGCTKEMAELLIKLQKGGVQLSGAEDLFELIDLPNHLTEIWEPHLVFRWYGNSPPEVKRKFIDLNSANPSELKKALKWPVDRINRLIRERQRLPFKDLADLQERIMLPPYIIEELIGKAQFGEKPPEPKLPPSH